ncbi:MAG TPA: alanine racemase [Asanoa sp.]|nr:alanine racemase [Asanoa sp.]
MTVADVWDQVRALTQERYGHHLNRSVDELSTPALVVDRDALDRNIDTMAAALDGQRARLRPHVKVQKSPDLALRQLAGGAIGITVATVWEAAAMAGAGVGDILIANLVVGPEKIAAAAALARDIRLAIAVDDERNIAALSAAAVRAGSTLGILVDLDVGMARCGARSTAAAVRLGHAVVRAPGLELRGIQAYEGHCMLEPDPAKRRRLALEAMDYAGATLDAFAAAGLPHDTLSGGGTGTYDLTGHDPRVTELQAGSYVFMDAFHGSLVPGFEVSLTALTTVVARHGDTLILDCGRKSVGIDFVSPPLQGHDYVARYFAEEHALFDVDARLAADLGDRLRLVTGYAPTSVNLHDVLFVVAGDEVVEVWPVFPRGADHHGLLKALT